MIYQDIYIQLSRSNTDVVSLHNSEKKRESPRTQMKNNITLSKQRTERSRKFSLYLETSCHGVNLHNRVKVVNALINIIRSVQVVEIPVSLIMRKNTPYIYYF